MEDEVRSFLDKLDIPPDQHLLLDGEPPEKVDEERLRAFERGDLTAREEEEIAYLVTHYRSWYEADRRLVLGEENIAGEADRGDLAEDKSGDASDVGHMSPSMPQRRAHRGWRLQFLAIAASLLVAAFSLSWATWTYQQGRRTSEQLAALSGELQQARMDLGVVRKELLLEVVPSATSEMWGGEMSGDILQIEVPPERGVFTASDVSHERRKKAESAREPLQEIIDAGDAPGEAYLELAAVEIAVRRLDEAVGHLEIARELSGGDPAVDNVEAMWLIAKGGRVSENRAGQLLKASVAKHPGFLPGLYNLALFLQRTKQYEESKLAWNEYLKREDRLAYRKAAERHLEDLRAFSGGN